MTQTLLIENEQRSDTREHRPSPAPLFLLGPATLGAWRTVPLDGHDRVLRDADDADDTRAA